MSGREVTRFSLRVTDNHGLTHQTENFSVEVREPNLPPVMVGDQNFSMVENNTLSLTLNGATDPEEDALTYSLATNPTSGVLGDCLGGEGDLQCEFTPVQDFEGTVVFSYRANDGNRDSEMVSVVTIEVLSSNAKPVANAGSDVAGKAGQVVALDGSASTDSEGAALAFSWELSAKPAGSVAVLANINSATPTLIPDKDGSYTARLVVNDGEADGLSDDVLITVTGAGNSVPVLSPVTSPKTLQLGNGVALYPLGHRRGRGETSCPFRPRDCPPMPAWMRAPGRFAFAP